MQITLQQAFEILQDCVAVIVDGDALTYPSSNYLTGDLDNEFMTLRWQDGQGLTYESVFVEENNQMVEMADSDLVFTDTKGYKTVLTILDYKKLD